MDNFGNERAAHETRFRRVLKFRIWAIVLLLLLGAAGLFFILDPLDPEDFIMGWVAVGVGVILFAVLWIVSVRIRAKAVIFDEGVIVTNRGTEHKFHFNEIAGLRGNIAANAHSGAVIAGGVAGGMIGGMIAGAVAGAIGGKSTKERSLTSVRIVSNAAGEKDVTVLDAAGDELSRVYTQWLIAQKGITRENAGTLNMSFGDELELNNGVITNKQRRKDVTLKMSDITRIAASDNGVFLQFFGLNDRQKEKSLLSVGCMKINNIHLLMEIHRMIVPSFMPSDN